MAIFSGMLRFLYPFCIYYSSFALLSADQLLSCVRPFATPWTEAPQASLAITNSWSFLKLMSIKSVMPSNRLILCHPPSPSASMFPSIRVFSNELALHLGWPQYWSFSFRTDWFDLLAIWGTLKSLLQHHSLKAPILSAISLLYGPTLTSVHD